MSALRRGMAVVLVAIGATVLAAPPASAHAVLLRTQPSPQSTVERAPDSVRLEYSEPVETAFGAVRVYDVDGHRVDRGTVARAADHRVIDVPVQGVRDGTYTVTWRVVSADGHQVHGGFVFYVGAPSTISPVAVEGDTGGSTAVGWGFGVVRFAWFGALITLIGLAVARRFVWTPALRAAGLVDGDVAVGFRRRFGRALPAAWLVLLLAGLVSIVFQAASVSGLSLREAAGARVIGDVLGTTYGRAWMWQLALACVAALPVAALSSRRALLPGPPAFWLGVLAVVVTGLAATAAASGHARTDPHPLVAGTSIVVHLLSVGAWVGGLGALVLLGGLGWRSTPAEERGPLVRELVTRFTRIAMVAVAVVVVTGTVNALTSMAGVSDLWRTQYGRVVSAKVVLLVVALALARRHRSETPRRLAGPEPSAAVRSFTRTGIVELALLVSAVALAAALVALVPGRSLALAEKGSVSTERRAGAFTVQLFIDPTAVGANQVHVTYVDASGLAAAAVTNTSVDVTPAGGRARRVPMRLIAPGHFVGDVTFPRPGKYRLAARGAAGGSPVATQFTFSIPRSR